MNDLIRHALETRLPGLDVAVYDGPATTEEARMYGAPPLATARYTAAVPLDIAGRTWTIQVSLHARLRNQARHFGRTQSPRSPVCC